MDEPPSQPPSGGGDPAKAYIGDSAPNSGLVAVGWLVFAFLFLVWPVLMVFSNSSAGIFMTALGNVGCAAWLTSRVMKTAHPGVKFLAGVGFFCAVSVVQVGVVFVGCLVFLSQGNFGH